MIIQYNIVVTIVNLINDSTSKFSKIFKTEVTAGTDALLYNNYHILSNGVYILDMFEDEVNAYCKALNIQKSSIEIDEFEIVSLTERTDVFFESEEDNSISLKPIIKCYIFPKNDALKVPNLIGTVYDSTTIIWSWPEDEQYAHYLVEEAIDPNSEANKSKIIAQLPIGATSYTETGLEPNTPYTRRLINYTDEQTSIPSASVTVRTETVEITQSLESYSIPRIYDFTTDDSERDIIEERLPAFHSGIGDDNDLKVYKQMDADFYQMFKAYFEITGKRTQREKRYDQVGFNYKVCLEGKETVEEQEGEVTFDIDVYPREWVTIEDYIWATHPVEVKAKLSATVFLRKEISSTEETEVIQLYAPDSEEEPIYTAFASNTAIIISVDSSSSMAQGVGGATRYAKTQKATKALVDAIEAKAKENTDTYHDKLIQYVIVAWATRAKVMYSGYSATEAKEALGKITFSNSSSDIGYYTNWHDGLTTCIKQNGNKKWVLADVIADDREQVGQIFFTDGFVNTDEEYNFAYKASDTDSEDIIKSIGLAKSKLDEAGILTYFVFGNGAKYVDTDYSDMAGAKAFAKDKIVPEVKKQFTTNGTKYYYYPGYSASMDSMTETKLAKKLIKGLKMFGKEITGYKTTIDGWKLVDEDETTSTIQTYNIDEVKAVTVTSDIYSFTFNNTITPDKYIPSEKRAIIPSTSFLSPTKLSSQSIYNIIMDKVKQTAEWQAGYNKTVGTTNNTFLVKGLFIQDTYNFADEDEITEDNWGAATWEYGMNGTVNVYTDVNKAGTSTYGDDCYLVSTSNYLMIQGYTDAILYDHTRFVRTELNAYDNPQQILIAKGNVYNSLLTNRKKPSLTYTTAGGINPLSHIVTLTEKGKDIYITGYTGLNNVGDWIYINPFTNDLIAHNDTVHESPVLNYRFNLEDPDAKTPICEILPTCDPDSSYLNIVFLHVYYAKNVYITSENNYIQQFGTDPVATSSSPYIPLTEGVYQWTLKEWHDGVGRDNGWYIDQYIWFMAKPMTKVQDYYDELPGEGMDIFYGLVNGRYRSDNQNGRQNLIVDVPQFNIPTTVDKSSIKIYIMITEFYPDTALVSYKWEHPWNDKDDITQVNGDYVTFSSDSLTYRDIEYYDVIETINMENQEIFNNKTTEKVYELTKPATEYEYDNYYLEVTTDNSDVLALRYPTEITYNNDNTTEIGVAFKGVVNATSKWSPRIHNGYYYLNQHEYFAYSEFNVEANFDTYEESSYKTAKGYITFDVQLRHKAKPTEQYSITKNTRSELLQNEEEFQWVNEKGVTLKPYIDGVYYKKYLTYIYYSPIILFENQLTSAGTLSVDYNFEDGSSLTEMEVRSYDIENGKWTDWVSFTNNTIPNTLLSHAYQVRFSLQASVQNTDLYLEDYMCCYLDWKEDMDETNTTNIVTITDHMTTGPDKAKGIYISKIIDYGCETELKLDIFESYYNDHVQVYLAYSSNKRDSLLLENASWINITGSGNTTFKARYFRYKIIIPDGEKLYWLRKRIQTLETHTLLPYITGISMDGTYVPSDVVTNFINIESFEISKDGELHTVIDKVSDIISTDVLERGYTEQEIEYIDIQCTNKNIELSYNSNLNTKYPYTYLSESVNAKSDIDVSITIKNTPYIFVEEDCSIKIKGTPQQYCPITVEDTEGNSYIQLHDSTSFVQIEEYLLTEKTKYLQLKTNRYDTNFAVYKDDELMSDTEYTLTNHLIIFNDFIETGHTIKIEYYILRSFIADIDRINNITTIYLYPGKDVDIPEKCKVYFETSTKNNKFIANDLSLNPIYRTDYKGFIYLTDDHNDPYELKIYCNPLRLKAGGYDKVDVSIEVLDIQGNPVISKDVAVDCEYGILNCDNYETDINGVIHLVYESAYSKCNDKLTARVLTDDNTIIEQSITIINE